MTTINLLPISVDECYHAEAPFQVFWFVVNFSITVVLTILIEMLRPHLSNKSEMEMSSTILDLDPQNVLNMKAAMIENLIFFKSVVSIIFVTGILSLLLFFVMKRLQCAQSQGEKFWLLVNLNSRFLPRKNLCV